MRKTFILAAVALGLASRAGAQASESAHLLDLSCVEALVSVDQARLAGVFSFIAEKDAVAAFADLLARDPGSLKKFLAKVEKDLSQALGISKWDRDALAAVMTLYGSPLGDTLPKPAPKVVTRIGELTQAPVMPLEQITARRKKG